LPCAVGAFTIESGNKTFARFYDFLETPPANVLLNLLPLAGASSDLIFGVVPYSVEKESAVIRHLRLRSWVS
jgi:fumarate reductase subunit C